MNRIAKAVNSKTTKKISFIVLLSLCYIVLFFNAESFFCFHSALFDSGEHYTLKSGEVLRQSIDGDERLLKSVSIKIGTFQRTNEGEICVRILDGSKVVAECKKDTTYLVDCEYNEFEFEKAQKLKSSHNYVIEVSASFEGDNYIAVFLSTGGDGLYSSVDNKAMADKTLCYGFTLVDGKSVWVLRLSALVVFVIFAVIYLLLGDFEKYSVLKAIIISACVSLIIFTMSFDLFKRINKSVTISEHEPGNKTVISAGESKDFAINNQRCSCDSIEFYLLGANRDNIKVKMIGADDGIVYYDGAINDDQVVADGEDVGVRITPKDTIKKKKYIVTISNVGKENLEISTLGEDERLNYGLVKETNLGTFLGLAVVILTAVYLVIIYWCKAKDVLNIYRFYMITSLFMGVIYLMLITPWGAPDTGAHYTAIYRLSNRLLGHWGEEIWSSRREDAIFYSELWGHDSNPSMKSYADLFYNYRFLVGDRTLGDMPERMEHMSYYSVINYWPEVIAMSVGRLLSLSAITNVYLSRIAILSFYIWGCFNAIRKTPVGKSVFTLVSLLPMSLMMSSACSYDPMVIITSTNFTAVILALYYKPDSKRLMIEACIWAFMMGAVKGGGYLLLLPLALMLIRRTDLKKSVRTPLLVISSGLFSVLLFDKLLQIGKTLFQFGADGGAKLQASYMTEHPVIYLKMMIHTYLEQWDLLSHNMMGTMLNWLEPTVPNMLIIVMVAVMCIYAVFEKDDIKLTNIHKVLFGLVVFICLCFTPMMLLSWTNKGSIGIDGLQGRYYFPVLIPMLLIITKFSLNRAVTGGYDTAEKKEVRDKCLAMFAIFSSVVVYYMLRLFLTR